MYNAGGNPTPPAIVAVAAVSYMLGSIPSGYLLSRAAGLGDIRKVGSGNIGATNVLRTGRRSLALLTLALDAAKGFIPVSLSYHFFGLNAALVAAAAALLGHLFPAWLGFRGGKGVATYIGVLFALSWQAGTVFCCVWLAAALAFHYSSLAALLAAAFTPLFVLTQSIPSVSAVVFSLSALVIARHHQNIRNLLRGNESRIRLQAPDP